MYRKSITRWYDAAGKRVRAGTPGAEPRTTKSKKWYANIPDPLTGKPTPTPLSSNRDVSKQAEARLRVDAEAVRLGVAQPWQRWSRVPLRDQVEDWLAEVSAGTTRRGPPSPTRLTRLRGYVESMLDATGAVFAADLTLAAVQAWLSGRRAGGAAADLPPGDTYDSAQVARALGIARRSLPRTLQRAGLRPERGPGGRLVYGREMLAELLARRARGWAPGTARACAAGCKRFSAWLHRRGRAPSHALDELRPGAEVSSHRRDRRALSGEQLARLLEATRDSPRVLRGLCGADRWALYLAALSTGFRRGELAELCPEHFRLDATPPVVTLPEHLSKNREGAVQPVPPAAAEALRGWLAGRPAGEPLWGRRWAADSAEVLRADLRDAGVPYREAGPDGPLFADFHALRHTFVALLDRAGTSLKQAMQLARHSDPRLTLRVYGRARLQELAEAVAPLGDVVAPGLHCREVPGRNGTQRDAQPKAATGPQDPAQPAAAATDAAKSRRRRNE